jgi:cytochrome c2
VGRRAVAAASLGAALVLTACGGGEETTGREGADTNNGKELFIEKCGSCHTLSDAGTQGRVGPNLDNAFGYPRRQGFDETTFYDITLQQIDLAAPPMPADLVKGQDAVDVAAYVARAAKLPEPPP